MSYPRPPDSYRDRFDAFYDRYVEPALPLADAVFQIHLRLRDYLFGRSSSTFIVRNFGEFQRAGFPYPVPGAIGLRFFCGDNEPALWFFARARLQDFDVRLPSVSTAIAERSFPISISTNGKNGETKSDWPNWGKETWEDEVFSGSGWYHAHLFDAAKGIELKTPSAPELSLRMWRFLHPANHFPMPTHAGKRIRFQSETGPADMSEGPGIKRYIAERFRIRYASFWDEFLEYAQGRPFPSIPNEPTLVYHRVMPPLAVPEPVMGGARFATGHQCRKACEDVRRVRQMERQGLTRTQIAGELGVSPARIRELSGNYNKNRSTGVRKQICPHEPFQRYPAA